MPELPEVEVTRRSLAEVLEGAHVRAVETGLPLRHPLGRDPASFAGDVAGAMQRRGKYLWLPLARPDGAPDGGLLIHLGMSGALSFHPASMGAAPPGSWDHFRLHADRGELRLSDPRRFGAVVWSPSLDELPARKMLSVLGPEPTDPALTDTVFHAALRRRRTPVKTALLSGELVVGAGNIYACEALFLAGIDPRTPCDRLGPRRAARLLAAVRQVLARAIEAGGSTLRDFHANGAAGHYQQEARVYGREGLPCLSCATPVKRIVQGQRSTYYCPKCQRR
jgi:formamidopyrimidine-DNA glycosylase